MLARKSNVTKNASAKRQDCVVPGLVRLPLPEGMVLHCGAGGRQADDAPKGFKISYICVWMARDAGVAEKEVK